MHHRKPLPLALAALAAVTCTLPAREARATGMQGHIYMAQCAAELVNEPRVRKLLGANLVRLANGAFFPDSGYTAKDHDQGEIPHWEQYVEGYVQTIRERSSTPFDDPATAQHIVTLMGAAAHGITDSTFDTLMYARSEQIDAGDVNELDMSMDIFLVAKLRRSFVPEFDYDAQTLSDVFNLKVKHPVAPEAITSAMKTARTGIAAVTNVLSKSSPAFEAKHAWAAASFLDGRTPGGYPFGARVTARYYEELARRIDGDHGADKVVIGTYPDELTPLTTLRKDRVDAHVVFFFGHGLDRTSFDGATSVEVTGPDGAKVPAEAGFFRGDQWPNVVEIKPLADWAPATTYRVVIKKTLRTLHGASPSNDLELLFTTCTPDPTTGDCAPPTGPAPASLCPENDARYVLPPDEPEDPPTPGPSAAPSTSAPPASPSPPATAAASSSAANEGTDDGSCAYDTRRGRLLPAAMLLVTALAAALWRRASHRRG